MEKLTFKKFLADVSSLRNEYKIAMNLPTRSNVPIKAYELFKDECNFEFKALVPVLPYEVTKGVLTLRDLRFRSDLSEFITIYLPSGNYSYKLYDVFNYHVDENLKMISFDIYTT